LGFDSKGIYYSQMLPFLLLLFSCKFFDSSGSKQGKSYQNNYFSHEFAFKKKGKINGSFRRWYFLPVHPTQKHVQRNRQGKLCKRYKALARGKQQQEDSPGVLPGKHCIGINTTLGQHPHLETVGTSSMPRPSTPRIPHWKKQRKLCPKDGPS